MDRREAIRRTALMLGLAISPSLLTAVARAQTAAAAGSKPKTTYLTPAQLETAGALAERIIPRTDTPGALEVGLIAFLGLIYGEFMSQEERDRFTQGLAAIDAASVAVCQTRFARASPEQQDVMLRKLAEASQNQENTFCHQIRELTLLGYFTSEQVGKNVLRYDPIPGRFDPCIPVTEAGNVSWTT